MGLTPTTTPENTTYHAKNKFSINTQARFSSFLIAKHYIHLKTEQNPKIKKKFCTFPPYYPGKDFIHLFLDHFYF